MARRIRDNMIRKLSINFDRSLKKIMSNNKSALAYLKDGTDQLKQLGEIY